MPISILFAVLFAALLHASWNIIVKSGGNKLFETGLNSLGGFLGAVCLVPFAPPLQPAAWPFLAASCACHLGYYLCISSAYEKVDLTFGYTVMRGCAPLLTSIAMLALGVSMSADAWCGVITLCCGILCLASDNIRRGARWRDMLIPLRVSFLIMGYTLADGFGAQRNGNAASYASWIFLINVLPIHTVILGRYGRAYVEYARKRVVVGVCGGLAGFASYGIAIWAMTVAPIAVVAALRETSVIFGMLLAVALLHERFTMLRALSVVLVVCGGMLLKLF